MAGGGLGTTLTSIRELNQELKRVKDEMANLDPSSAAFANAAQRAGELRDQINNVNETVAQFAAGSKFEQFGNVLGGVGSKLASLDFEGAAEDAKKLASIKFNFADGIKAVKDLGSTFLNLGKALLSNPLFLIAAIITLIIVAMVKLRDKVKWIADIFKFLGDVIGAVIQFFKDLGDWLGLTSFAAEEKAEATIEAAKKEQKAVTERYDAEIAYASAAGESTEQLEIAKRQAVIDTNNTILQGYKDLQDLGNELDDDQKKDLEERTEANRKAAVEIKSIWIKTATEIAEATKDANAKLRAADLNAEADSLDKTQALIKEKYTKIYQDRREHYQKLLDAAKGNATLIAQINAAETTEAVAEGINRQAELDKAEKADQKAKLDQYKAYLAARLSAARSIHDLELAAMKDGQEKEKAILDESYKRKTEDAKNNDKLTADERAKLIVLYAAELAQKEKELDEKYKKEAEARERDHQAKIFQYKKEQADKEAALIKSLRDLRDEIYLTDVQKAFKAVTDKANQEKAIAEQGFTEGLITKQQYDDAIVQIDKHTAEAQAKIKLDARLKEIDENQKSIKQSLDLAMRSTDALQGLSDVVFSVKKRNLQKGSAEELKAAKQQFNINKALGIASATITGIQAVLAAYRSGVETPIIGPATGAIYAAIAGVTAVANIAKIAATKFEAPATVSADSASGGGSAAAAAAQNAGTGSGPTSVLPSLFASNGNGNANNAGTNDNSQRTASTVTVSAVVVAQEITDAQTRNRYAENIGTL